MYVCISGVDNQGAYGAYARPVTKMHNIFEADECNGRMGTILIQQFRPSVCLSVTIRNCIKTAKCRSIYRPEMVEIISPPDSPVILAFGQLIAVTKFGRRSPLLRQILERYCAILSRIVRGLCQKRCKNSYNSGPFKSIVCPLSSGGYFHQSCHVTKACVSLH